MVHPLRFALCTEQNPRYKPQNEDSAAAGLIVNALGVRCHLGAVADGVSGLANGREASRLAVRGLVAELRTAKFASAADLVALAPDIFTRINEPIRSLSDRGSGTTLTAAVVVGRAFVVMHLGDSSCTYLGPDGSGGSRSLRLTREHTLVADATAAGADQAELDSLHQHALAACLGDPEVAPQIVVSPPDLSFDGGRLLLASDGVTDVWAPADLLAIADRTRDSAALCRALCVESLIRQTPQGRPNKDNITAVVLDLGALSESAPENIKFVGGAEDAPAATKPERGNRRGRQARAFALSSFASAALLAAIAWWTWPEGVVVKPKEVTSLATTSATPETARAQTGESTITSPIKPTAPMINLGQKPQGNTLKEENPAVPKSQSAERQSQRVTRDKLRDFLDKEVEYVIQHKDGLWTIADARYGRNLADKMKDEIAALNGIDDPNKVQEGATVRLPPIPQP